jgi:hypothetical protein
MLSFFRKRLDVQWLAAVIIASSLLSCLCVLLQSRVRDVNHWALCQVVAGLFGPLWSLFLVVLLVVAFYRFHKQHRLAFGFGLAFGVATFFTWFYLLSIACGTSRLQSILSILAILLVGAYAVYLVYHRRMQ